MEVSLLVEANFYKQLLAEENNSCGLQDHQPSGQRREKKFPFFILSIADDEGSFRAPAQKNVPQDPRDPRSGKMGAHLITIVIMVHLLIRSIQFNVMA